MATFASDSFAGTEDTELSAYDAAWTLMTGVTSTAEIANGRARNSAATLSAYRNTATPPSADYPVQASLYVASTTANRRAGVTGRASSSANSYYLARLVTGTGWQLAKVISGTFTQLGSSVAQTVSADTSYAVKLSMSGSTIELYKLGEGTAAVSVTDTALSAAGFAGLYFNSGIAADNEAVHIDDWSAGEAGVTIQPSGIASAETFGTAAFTRTSVQSVSPSGIASAEAFGTATFARTSLATVSPSGIASAEAFGTAAFSTGGVVVPGIPSAEAFGTATFSRSSVQSVAPTGIGSAEAFGVATVTRQSVQAISVSGIASAEAFGTATFTRSGQVNISPTGIASAEAFGTATLTRTSLQSFAPGGIASAEAFGTPTFSIPGDRTLTAQDLADIADAVWAHPKALTIARFLGLK